MNGLVRPCVCGRPVINAILNDIMRRKRRGSSGVEGLLTVVVLEVTTEGVRTGRGTERWRQRVAVQVAAAAAPECCVTCRCRVVEMVGCRVRLTYRPAKQRADDDVSVVTSSRWRQSGHGSRAYELSPDLREKQVEMLCRSYGGATRASHAARVIQVSCIQLRETAECPSVCPSVCLSLQQSSRSAVYSSVKRPSVRLSVRPSVCPCNSHPGQLYTAP